MDQFISNNGEQLIKGCPIQQQAQKFKVIKNMEERKKKYAYNTILNELYIAATKHEAPAIPISNLKIVTQHIKVYLAELLDPDHVIIVLLFLNTAFQPCNLIASLTQQEHGAMLSIKKEILSNDFIQVVFSILIEYATQGDELNSQLQQYTKQKQNLQEHYQKLVSKLKEQNYKEQQNNKINEKSASSDQPEAQSQISEGIKIQINTQDEKQEEASEQQNTLSIQDKISSNIHEKDFKIPEDESISEISNAQQAQNIQTVNQQIISYKTFIADNNQHIIEIKEKLLNIIACLTQFFQLFYNLFNIDPQYNEIFFQKATEFQLFRIIENVNVLCLKYKSFQHLQMYIFRTYCCFMINQPRINNIEQKIFLLNNNIQQNNQLQQEIKIQYDDKEVFLNQKSMIKDNILKSYQNIDNSQPLQQRLRLSISRSSSVAPNLIKQIQSSTFNQLLLSQNNHNPCLLENNDLSYYRQKMPQKINKYDKEIDNEGKTIQPSGLQNIKKTIETTEIPTSYQFIKNIQFQNEQQQLFMIELLRNSNYFFQLLQLIFTDDNKDVLITSFFNANENNNYNINVNNENYNIINNIENYIQQQIRNFEENNKIKSCFKYNYVDLKLQRKAFIHILILLFNSMNTFYIENLVKIVNEAENVDILNAMLKDNKFKTFEQFNNIFKQNITSNQNQFINNEQILKMVMFNQHFMIFLNKISEEIMDVSGEYKTYVYEYQYVKEEILNYIYYLLSLCKVLISIQIINKFQYYNLNKAVISQQALINNLQMLQLLNLNQEQQQTQLNTKQNELQQLNNLINTYQIIIQQLFQNLFNSSLMDFLSLEFKKFELLKYNSQKSTETFIKMLLCYKYFKNMADYLKNDESQLIKVVIKYKKYKQKEVEVDLSENSVLQHVDNSISINKSQESDNISSQELIDETDQIQMQSPDCILLNYLLHNKLPDKLCLMVYVITQHYISRDQVHALQLIVEVFSYLEQFDSNFKEVSIQLQNYNNLRIVEFIVNQKIKYLGPIQKIFKQILTQIFKQQTKTEQINQFINSIFILQEFKYKYILQIANQRFEKLLGNDDQAPISESQSGDNKQQVKNVVSDSFSEHISDGLPQTQTYQDDTNFNQQFQHTSNMKQVHQDDDDLWSSSDDVNNKQQIQNQINEIDINDIIQFTPEEDEYLINHIIGLSIQYSQQIAINKIIEYFDYKYDGEQILQRFDNLNKQNRIWTDIEQQFVVNNQNRLTQSEIAKQLKRNEIEIIQFLQTQNKLIDKK